MLVWAGFDEDSVLEKNIGGAQNVFAAIDGVCDMVEAASRAGMVARVSEIVALVADREPHARFRSIVHHDLFGEPATQVVLEKNAVRLNIDGEAVEMIKPTDVDAASRESLRLILESRAKFRGRFVPFGFIVELDAMPIRVNTH